MINDHGIVDIIQDIGWEHFGIEQVILSFGNFEDQADTTTPAWFDDAAAAAAGVEVVHGGGLFYFDWHGMDYVQPELVIMGARAFGMNRDGDRHPAPYPQMFRDATENRFPHTPFVRMTINAQNSHLRRDITNNVGMLAEIFPNAAPLLNAALAEIDADMTRTFNAVRATPNHRALFIQMAGPNSIGVFVADSRFDMIYDEFGFIPASATPMPGGLALYEQVAWVGQVNPDVIFFLDRTGNMQPGNGTPWFLGNADIQSTNAFINGNIIYDLPSAEWYTVVGGLGATRQMIADANRFLD
jgi:iron complex transport system substrate-binding protein